MICLSCIGQDFTSCSNFGQLSPFANPTERKSHVWAQSGTPKEQIPVHTEQGGSGPFPLTIPPSGSMLELRILKFSFSFPFKTSKKHVAPKKTFLLREVGPLDVCGLLRARDFQRLVLTRGQGPMMVGVRGSDGSWEVPFQSFTPFLLSWWVSASWLGTGAEHFDPDHDSPLDFDQAQKWRT